MRRATPSSRWALWVFALALLLKSAMPFLATASAEQQGRALAEVCTVYGVATVAVGAARHGAPDAPATDHAGEHCTLTALAAAMLGEPPSAVALPAAAVVAPALREETASVAVDAAARWSARLRHAPPRST